MGEGNKKEEGRRKKEMGGIEDPSKVGFTSTQKHE